MVEFIHKTFEDLQNHPTTQEFSVEIIELINNLSETTTADQIFENLLVFYRYVQSIQFINIESSCKVSLKLFSKKMTVGLVIENLQIKGKKFFAELKELETFSFGRHSCEIFVDSDKTMTFSNKNNLIYINTNSEALLQIDSMELATGLRFIINKNCVSVAEIDENFVNLMIYDKIIPISENYNLKALFSKECINTEIVKIGSQ